MVAPDKVDTRTIELMGVNGSSNGLGFIVMEVVDRVLDREGNIVVARDRIWGMVLPIQGMWQATDTDGNNVGEPVRTLQDAVDILFLPVRTS